MAYLSTSFEKRPLKRPRLGPPEFYPQEPKQKEDELTAEKLKQGYSNNPPFANEYDSAREKKPESSALAVKPEAHLSKITAFYNAVTAKKLELNAIHDSKKKVGNKDVGFWLVSSKPKADVWFKDLAGSKPLLSLAKRVPIFNKREEVFSILCEFQVSMCRAIWFIKSTASHITTQQENKPKKTKQSNDSCAEWTTHLVKYLRELLFKLSDYYLLNGSSSQVMQVDVAEALKQWQYTTRLARCMDEEGLVDRQEYLKNVLDILSDKCRSSDEGILRLIVPFVMQHMDGFVQSEILSRRLAICCAKKLTSLYYDSDCGSPCSPTESRAVSPINSFGDMNCPLHRYLVLSFSAIVHAILAECPTALVWNNLNGGAAEHTSGLCGSPLDLLPSSPSQLPMPPGDDTEKIRKELKSREEEVRKRSMAVDIQWSSDKCQQSGLGTVVQQLLAVLDVLDRHKLDRADESSTDALYAKVFSAMKDNEDAAENDRILVRLLCQWAITSHRFGHYRAAMVARLLDKRQSDIATASANVVRHQDSTMIGEALTPDPVAPMEHSGSISTSTAANPAVQNSSAAADSNNGYPLQSALLEFLDNEAPTIEEGQAPSAEFANCVLLFGELIREDVFSHDQYISTLIGRGDLTTGTIGGGAGLGFGQSNQTPSNSKRPDNRRQMLMMGDHTDSDDMMTSVDLGHLVAKLSDDSIPMHPMGSLIDKTLDHLKYEKPPLSVGSFGPASIEPHFPQSVEPAMPPQVLSSKTQVSKHYVYVLHFPLPQNDEYKHESNQRETLMFGCGQHREEQKHMIRKVTKELNKLWHKKNSVTVSEGVIVKPKRGISQEALATLANKFKSLFFHDQSLLVETCADACVDVVQDFINGRSPSLPALDNVDYLLTMMENSLCLWSIVDFSTQMLSKLKRVEAKILESRNRPASFYSYESYSQTLALCFVGFLRRFHSYLILNEEDTLTVFEGLAELLKVKDSREAASPYYTASEKCIWAYLYHLFTNCSAVKAKFSSFEVHFLKIRQFLTVGVSAVSSNAKCDREFLRGHLENPKKPIEPEVIKQLSEIPAARYSFVVSALLTILNCHSDTDRVRDISLLSCELTCRCPALTADWLGVLKALCYPNFCADPDKLTGFSDFLVHVDLNDPVIYQPLSLFVVLMVGRHCIRLEDFVRDVALYSLVAAKQSSGSNNPDMDAEPGARLTFYLLSSLMSVSFKGNRQMCAKRTKLASDQYLLTAAQGQMCWEGVCSFLQISVILADMTKQQDPPGNSKGGKEDLFAFLHEMDCVETGASNSSREACLAQFASEVLKAVCSQEWVRQKLTQESDLFHSKFLLHKSLNSALASRILRLLTRGDCEAELVTSLESATKTKDLVIKLLNSLSIWNLRASLLELKLLHRQAEQNDQNKNSEINKVVDAVAKGCLDLFQNQPEPSKRAQLPLSLRPGGISPVWLVAPLVSQLSKEAQGRVLKVSADVLEKDKSTLQRNSWLLSEQPFLSLVLTCLRGQDEQREPLLNNLFKQLQQYALTAKQDPMYVYDRDRNNEIHEALQLRLSLVGGMFETVCKSVICDQWALLLLQLLLYNVVSINTDRQLFYTCVDMLAVLIHSVCAADGEESRRNNNRIMKLLKKELGDKFIPSLRCIHQLLPIPRHMIEVVACEPYGSTSAPSGSKGPKPSSSVPAEQPRPGLQIAGKNRVSPWDIIEGRTGALNWSWFRGVRIDTVPECAAARVAKLLPHEHYHQYKRPAHPGDNQTDPFLEFPNIPRINCGSLDDDMMSDKQADNSIEVLEQVGSPKTTAMRMAAGRGANRKLPAVRGGQRKNSRNATTPTTTMPVRGIPFNTVQAGPTAPMGYNLAVQPQPYSQGVAINNNMVGMNQSYMQIPQQQAQQFPPHPQQYPAQQPPVAKDLLRGVIRNRQPSGAVPVMVPQQQQQPGVPSMYQQPQQIMETNQMEMAELNRRRQMANEGRMQMTPAGMMQRQQSQSQMQQQQQYQMQQQQQQPQQGFPGGGSYTYDTGAPVSNMSNPQAQQRYLGAGQSQEGMNMPQPSRQLFNQGPVQGQMPPTYSRVMAAQQEMPMVPQSAMRYQTQAGQVVDGGGNNTFMMQRFTFVCPNFTPPHLHPPHFHSPHQSHSPHH